MKDYDKKIYSKSDIINIIDKALKDNLEKKNKYIEKNGFKHKDTLNAFATKATTLFEMFSYFDC